MNRPSPRMRSLTHTAAGALLAGLPWAFVPVVNNVWPLALLSAGGLAVVAVAWRSPIWRPATTSIAAEAPKRRWRRSAERVKSHA